MIRLIGRAAAFLFLAGTVLPCQQEPKAGDITVRNFTLEKIVHAIRQDVDAAIKPKPGAGTQSEERATVFWILDSSAATQNQTLKPDPMSRLLATEFKGLEGSVKHAVIKFNAEPVREGPKVMPPVLFVDPTPGGSRIILEPTADLAKVEQAVTSIVDDYPDNSIKNCHFVLRRTARYAATFPGRRFLVLVTADNGDSEDEIEETRAIIRDSKVTLDVIAPETSFSDRFWCSCGREEPLRFRNGPPLVARSAPSNPKYWRDILWSTVFVKSDTHETASLKLPFALKGPESAFPELPYGWLLNYPETAPSGFGIWSLTRFAAATDNGKYFLFTPHTLDFCPWVRCPICNGGHDDCGAVYDDLIIKLAGPDVDSRGNVVRHHSAQPLTTALYRIWLQLFEEGLVFHEPPLQMAMTGNILGEAQPKNPRAVDLGGFIQTRTGDPAGAVRWKDGMKGAQAEVAFLSKVIAELDGLISRERAKAPMRPLATAETLLLYLCTQRFNLQQFALFGGRMSGDEPPVPQSDMKKDANGAWPVAWRAKLYYFCHGELTDPKGLLWNLPVQGGDRERAELRSVLKLADKLATNYRGTPWGILARRACIMRFGIYATFGGGGPGSGDGGGGAGGLIVEETPGGEKSKTPQTPTTSGGGGKTTTPAGSTAGGGTRTEPAPPAKPPPPPPVGPVRPSRGGGDGESGGGGTATGH